MSLQYSMITSAGLQEIDGLDGKYIEIAYWLPALDEKTYPITDITSATAPNDTVVSGDEVYWATGVEPNNPAEPIDSDLYKGVTYNSSLKTCGENGETVSRGNFQVVVKLPEDSTHDDMKFNKLGLYAVVRDNTGTITKTPFLFAQAITPYPQHIISKENIQTSASTFNEFIVDVQLELDKENTDFEDIIYGSTNDYWERVVNNNGQCGLLYNGSVFITNRLGMDDAGSYDVVDDVGVAKTLISTFHTLNNENSDAERTLPQLGLQYVDYPSNNNSIPSRIRTTFRTTDEGHLEINMEGGCNEDHFYSIVPKKDGEFGLGISTRRWKSLFLSSSFEMYSGELSDSFDGFYLKISDDDNAMRVYNGSIYCGPYYSKADITEKNNTHYFNGNISSYENNGIDHDLLIRSFKSIGIINLKQESKTLPSKRVIDGIKGVNGMRGILNIMSDDHLYIASKNIYTFGNIIPLYNNTHNIGDSTHRYNAIHTKSLVSGTDGNIIVDGNLISGNNNGNGWNIGNSENGAWNEITCKNVGKQNNPVNESYILTVTTSSMRLSSTDDAGIYLGDQPFITGTQFIPPNNYIIGSEDKKIKEINVDELNVDTLTVSSINFTQS